MPALEWLVRVMSEQQAFTINLHHQVDNNLASDIQTLVFRVVQEALTNAIKHAKASLITINVIATKSMLMVKVKDNGQGMELQPDDLTTGFGLGAMQRQGYGIRWSANGHDCATAGLRN